jgi:hypothetical protein
VDPGRFLGFSKVSIGLSEASSILRDATFFVLVSLFVIWNRIFGGAWVVCIVNLGGEPWAIGFE